jgi:carbamoyl-phosphate synthase small subunit
MPTKLPITKRTSPSASPSRRGIFFENTLTLKPGILSLEDGTRFTGQMPDWQSGPYFGEVVFNTGMSGYVESLTDPSYSGQILVFTYPLIGNYGVQPDSAESDKIQVRGVVVSDAALRGSHADSKFDFPQWLQSQDIPLLTGVDTRALTKHLRSKGTMAGAIGEKTVPIPKDTLQQQYVSIDKPRIYNDKQTKHIILVDCGMKGNILRTLQKLPVQIKRVPYDYDYSAEDYDGVFYSNGPGDPENYTETVRVARKVLKSGKPVFGICLGSQIMALAAGAKTYKLKFGHRGHNQPCLDSGTERGYITSQNHGYAIDEKSLPSDWRVTFRNLNDDSVEGIEHRTKPYFSVQFHPEACPGPTDTAWLFERFHKSL